MNPIFVVRLTAIGDTVIAARAAATLAEHGGNVVFVTHISQRDVVAAIPALQRFILVDEQYKLTAFQRTSAHQFEAVDMRTLASDRHCDAIDLQGTARSRRALAAIQDTLAVKLMVRRVPKRSLYRLLLIFLAWLFGRQRVRRKAFEAQQIVRVSQLQEQLVASYLQQKGIAYRGPAACYLDVAGSRQPKNNLPYVLIFVGASFILKAWPKEQVRAFIRGVLSSSTFNIVLCGGKDDEEVAHYLTFDNPTRIENRVGKTTLSEVMALAKDASFILTNDSFGAHLADAFKKKAAVIFGATSPKFGFAPRENSVRVHYANLDCSPCARHGQGRCRFRNLKCLTAIQPSEVLENLLKN